MAKSRCSSAKSELGSCFLNQPRMFPPSHRAWNEGPWSCHQPRCDVSLTGAFSRSEWDTCTGQGSEDSVAELKFYWPRLLENVSGTAETGKIGRRSWLPSIGGHLLGSLSRTHQAVPQFSDVVVPAPYLSRNSSKWFFWSSEEWRYRENDERSEYNRPSRG